MKHFWNERYSLPEYVYGDTPNTFFREQLEKLKPGTILLPGEGEGRNAVWAASAGWQVVAVDYSEAAREKALALAAKKHTNLNQYLVEDLNSFMPLEKHYDAIALIFVHLMPTERQLLHQKLLKALKPGGTIIIEAFHPDQLQYNSGGPKNYEMLYTSEMLLKDFDGLKINFLDEGTYHLSEGNFHRGEAALVRMSMSLTAS
jgi:SAM-dependent methyltransferase